MEETDLAPKSLCYRRESLINLISRIPYPYVVSQPLDFHRSLLQTSGRNTTNQCSVGGQKLLFFSPRFDLDRYSLIEHGLE